MKIQMMLLPLLGMVWGSMTQVNAEACPCVDKETLTINLVYHQSDLIVDQVVGPHLQNSEVIALVKDSLVDHDAKIKELNGISINAGIPLKPTDLSQGFVDRAKQALPALSTLSGSALESAYLNFRADELQRLVTAFDTYFIPEVTTPTMKAWVPLERARLWKEYSDTRALIQKLSNPLFTN